MKRTHYDVLGVTPEAPEEVIRASYAALMRRAHPDTGNSDPERVRQLNEARRVLMDRERRAEYDRSLEELRSPAEMEPTIPAGPAWGAESEWDEADAPSAADAAQEGVGVPGSGPGAPPPYPPFHEQPGTHIPLHPTHGGHPGYGVAPGPQISQRGIGALWRSETPVERILTWAWVVLSLLGPALIVATAILRPSDRLDVGSNLFFYAVPLLVSVHVGLARLTRPRVPKRYILWLLLGIGLMWGARTDPPLALLIAAWITTFVVGVETKRRRLWGTS